jgi:hypothetical protein
MDTAYKSRTWWMLRALAYVEPLAAHEETCDTQRDRGAKVPGLGTHDQEQHRIWLAKGAECSQYSVAPSGSECLTRLYVDRQGNLLPEC